MIAYVIKQCQIKTCSIADDTAASVNPEPNLAMAAESGEFSGFYLNTYLYINKFIYLNKYLYMILKEI